MNGHTFDDGYITVKEGILRGSVEDGIKVFRGVPYAKPPVGELRWKDPVPPAKWFGVRAADRYSAGALQWDVLEQEPYAEYELGAPMHSEDCLYLNLFTPAKTQDEKLPIFVWVHGGGMVAGSGMASFFEGEQLAKKGIIVAVINYRLGLFGFFCHPQLSAESPRHTSGNYALMDIRQAVLWLRENAASFGGDPDRITVGGQSGGSVGTTCLALSPLMEGLCQGYIMESGCPLYGFMQAGTLSEMEQKGAAFASELGVSDISELRAIDGCDLTRIAYAEKHFIPNYCVDGVVLPDSPWNLLHSGKINNAHLLIGSTSEEFGSLGRYDENSVTPQQFERYLEILVEKGLCTPEQQKILQQHYPHSNNREATRAALRIQSDIHTFGPFVFGSLAAKAGLSCYVYYKTRPDSGSRGEILGSTHSSELPFLFGRPEKCIINPEGMDKDDLAFGESLRSYWVNFIKTGNPSCGEPVPVEWKAASDLFDYLDLGREIHLPTEEERSVFNTIWEMLEPMGECTLRDFQTPEIMPK